MRKLLLLIIIFCGFTSTKAQLIKGTVFEKGTSTPIPYASLYVKDKNGVICDDNGRFTIDVDKISLNDTIIISCIGFEPTFLKKTDFFNKKEFYLNRSYTSLNPLVVLPHNDSYTVGKDNIGAMTVIFNLNKSDFVSNHPELGQLMKIEKRGLIKDVNIYLKRNTFDTLTLRLKIYSIKDGIPDKNLNSSDIYQSIYNKKTGWIKFNIEELNIQFDGNFICTFEILNWHPSEGYIGINGIPELFSKDAYFKGSLTGRWKKGKIKFSLYSTVKSIE